MISRNPSSGAEIAATAVMAAFGLAILGIVVLSGDLPSRKDVTPEAVPVPEAAERPDPDSKAPAGAVSVLLPPPPAAPPKPAAAPPVPSSAPPPDAAPLALPPQPQPLRPVATRAAAAPEPVRTMPVPLRQTVSEVREPVSAVRPLAPLAARAADAAPLPVTPIVPRPPAAQAEAPVPEPAATRATEAAEESPTPRHAAPPTEQAAEPVRPPPTPAERAAPPTSNTSALEADGRVLLRLLEHDSGPSIQVAWPEDGARRERMYAVLSACYGMKSAWITRDGRVTGDAELLGRDGLVQTDRYSGFIREAEGQLPAAEVSRLRSMTAPPGAVPVRLFPRRVDAIFLGGLRRIVGDAYAGTRSIVARYRLNRSDLLVEDIRVDGQAVDGTMLIPPVSRCGI